MVRNVAEYHGIKYSLQTKGLRSRTLTALAFFVAVFGGALLFMSPAQANPGDCFVEVTPDPNDPVPVTIAPVLCPTTPAPVTSTVTVTTTIVVPTTITETQTKTKTVTVTKTITVELASTDAVGPPLAPAVVTPPPSKSSTPSVLPQPTMVPAAADTDTSSLRNWGLGVAGVSSLVLVGLGVAGIVRRQRYRGAHQAEETPAMPVQDYTVSDYNPNFYSGDENTVDTEENPVVKQDDTKPLPKVE